MSAEIRATMDGILAVTPRRERVDGYDLVHWTVATVDGAQRVVIHERLGHSSRKLARVAAGTKVRIESFAPLDTDGAVVCDTDIGFHLYTYMNEPEFGDEVVDMIVSHWRA